MRVIVVEEQVAKRKMRESQSKVSTLENPTMNIQEDLASLHADNDLSVVTAGTMTAKAWKFKSCSSKLCCWCAIAATGPLNHIGCSDARERPWTCPVRNLPAANAFVGLSQGVLILVQGMHLRPPQPISKGIAEFCTSTRRCLPTQSKVTDIIFDVGSRHNRANRRRILTSVAKAFQISSCL